MDNQTFKKIVSEQSNLRTAYQLQCQEKKDLKNSIIRAKMQVIRASNPKKNKPTFPKQFHSKNEDIN
jgi:hypothetical protein